MPNDLRPLSIVGALALFLVSALVFHAFRQGAIGELTAGGIILVAVFVVLFAIVRRAGAAASAREAEIGAREDEIRGLDADRKRLERELYARKEGFRDFEEAGFDWYWETDADSQYVKVTDRFFELTGLGRDEVIGVSRNALHAQFLIDPDKKDRKKWETHLEDVASRKPFRNLTLNWQCADGGVRIFMLNGAPVVDAGGAFRGYRGLGSDITEMVHSQEAHRETEARMRAILDNAAAAVHIKDLEGRYLFVNLQFEALFGISADRLIGRTDEEIGETALSTAFSAADRKVLETHTHLEIEEAIQRPGGEGVFLAVRFPLRDRDGRIYGMCGMRTDISERKTMEADLRETQDRYALALKGGNDAIWDWNLGDGKYYASPRLTTILGYDESELQFDPESWRERIHPDDREAYSEKLRRHIVGGSEFFSHEYRVLNKDGDFIWVLDRGVALRDPDGAAYRMGGAIGDVSDRRHAEDRLRHMERLHALGQLAGGIAHEFNNLLVGIKGFSAMAADSVDKPERLEMCLEEMQKTADRASRLTGDLLNFSRKQRAKPKLEATALRALIEDAEPLLRTVVGNQITLTTKIEDGESLVLADAAQISQVVTNLAINARDAMPEGGTLTISTQVMLWRGSVVSRHPDIPPRSRWGCVCVADTGVGMDQDTLENLFEPFFTTKGPGKGTGLGLATVYGIVEQLGGFIDVESRPGLGAAFTIFLPLAESAESPAGEARKDEVVPRAPASILVAEDDENVALLIRETLEAAGHAVIEARNGRIALEKALKHDVSIDLLISDIVMPEMGGPNLARELLARKPGLRILFMSAYPKGERVLEEEWERKTYFIAKPFDPEDFLNAVVEVLNEDASA